MGNVADGPGRQPPRPGLGGGAFDGRREQLAQGLDAVEEAGWLAGGDPHQVWGDAQLVALLTQRAGSALQGQADAASGRGAAGGEHLQGEAGRRVEMVGQVLPDGLHFVPPGS